MDLFLLTTGDYSAVVGYAEHIERAPGGFSYGDNRRVNAYDTSGQPLFTRKGLSNAERRAHELGYRLVTAQYFGISTLRPEIIAAPAYARIMERERQRRLGGAACAVTETDDDYQIKIGATS